MSLQNVLMQQLKVFLIGRISMKLSAFKNYVVTGFREYNTWFEYGKYEDFFGPRGRTSFFLYKPFLTIGHLDERDNKVVDIEFFMGGKVKFRTPYTFCQYYFDISFINFMMLVRLSVIKCSKCKNKKNVFNAEVKGLEERAFNIPGKISIPDVQYYNKELECIMNILKHCCSCHKKFCATLPVMRIPRKGEGNVKDNYVIYSDGNIIFNKTIVNFTGNPNKTDEFLELLYIASIIDTIRYNCLRNFITDESDIFHKIVSELNSKEFSLWKKKEFVTV